MPKSRSRRASTVNQPVHLAWRASRGGLVALAFFSAFINLLKFATPLYLLQVLDRIPASRSVETLIMLTIMTLLAVTAGLALEAVRRRMLTRWGTWIEQQFGARLFQRGLMAGSIGRSLTVQQSLSDLARLRTFVMNSAAPWMDVLWAPVFIFGVYLVHPVFGAIGLVAVVLLVLLGVVQEALTRAPRRASRHASNDAGEIILAAERNIETVGALTMTPNLMDRWWRTTIARHNERDRSEARLALFGFLMKGLGQCTRIGVIGIGIWLFLQNSLTLGGIFAGRVMLGFGYGLVERAVRNWRGLRDAATAYQHVKEQLAAEDWPSPSVADATAKASLTLDQVSFRYLDQRDYIIRKLSLTLEPGEVLLVTGTATTGKTTLSRLLVGLLEPRYGQVRLGDIELTRLPAEMRAHLIGYLPQHTELFRGTVRENIARMGAGRFEDIVSAAKLVDIHDMIIQLPQGYDTEIHAEAVGLSGSERKRIALARAIYGRPRVLVLDEPAANLDRPSRRAMEAAVVELKKRGCSIVITQAIQSTRLSSIAEKFLILGGKSPELSVAEPQREPSPERASKGGLRSVT